MTHRETADAIVNALAADLAITPEETARRMLAVISSHAYTSSVTRSLATVANIVRDAA